MIRPVALAFAAAALAFPARAAEKPALFAFNVLTPAVALELAQATLESCRKANLQVAVAVVDRFGVPQVMLRDQLAGPHTPGTAERKAWTAVSFRADTLGMQKMTEAGQPQSGTRFIERAMMIGGGIPVEANGAIIAGVGVSGGPGGEADHACARDGIAAIEDKLF